MKKKLGTFFWWLAVASVICVGLAMWVVNDLWLFLAGVACLTAAGFGIRRYAPENKKDFWKLLDWL